jgi:two-component system, LytTR family, response regulator
MNCVIIDDDNGCIKTLSEIIKKYCPQLEIIESVNGISDAVNLLNKTVPDLVFLDVEMKNEVGFDLFKFFPSPNFKVVFTTAHEKYALKAIKSSCFDFLLKPIVVEEIIQVVRKLEIEKKEDLEKNVRVLLENINSKDGNIKKIAIPCADGLSFWDMDEIVCLEADGKYTKITAKNKVISLSSKNIGEFEEILDSEIFFRTHKSWIINLSYVKKFLKAENKVLLLNDLAADVSSRKKEEFLKLFSKA